MNPEIERFELRPASMRDISQLAQIEESSRDVWGRLMLGEVLRNHANGIVVDSPAGVIGFAVYVPQSHTIALLRIVVAPWVRRVGVGRMLVGRLQMKAQTTGKKLLAIVRETDDVSIRFFAATGFRAARLLRDEWPGEDGYLFISSNGRDSQHVGVVAEAGAVCPDADRPVEVAPLDRRASGGRVSGD